VAHLLIGESDSVSGQTQNSRRIEHVYLFGDNTPVAVFDTNEQLSAYINSLVAFGTSEIDPVLKAQSVLAGHKDHQSISVAQLWESHEDWQDKLEAAKRLPKNPTCAPKSAQTLASEKASLQAKRDALDAELASIESLL